MHTIVEVCPQGILSTEHDRRVPVLNLSGGTDMVPTVGDRPARINVHTGVFSPDPSANVRMFGTPEEARAFGEHLLRQRATQGLLGHTFEVQVWDLRRRGCP